MIFEGRFLLQTVQHIARFFTFEKAKKIQGAACSFEEYKGKFPFEIPFF